MKRICILIPVYNEEQTLPLLHRRLVAVCNPLPYRFRFLFVNDGSTDRSLLLLSQIRENDPRFCYLNLSRNYGKETAMLAGMDYFDEDALIFMDGDLQDPPELIPRLLREWEGGFDDVYAKRSSREGETFFKKGTSYLYYRVLARLSYVPIQKDTGDFRLLSRRCVLALRQLREQGRCTKSLFSWIGYSKKEIPFEREKRAAGNTKWNYKKLFDLAIDGITSLSTTPLRISGLAGIVSLAGSLLFLLLGLAPQIPFYKDTPLFFFLFSLILFLAGMQFFFLGILGEYIGRIFIETKHRPAYLAEGYNERKESNEETTSPTNSGCPGPIISYRRPS